MTWLVHHWFVFYLIVAISTATILEFILGWTKNNRVEPLDRETTWIMVGVVVLWPLTITGIILIIYTWLCYEAGFNTRRLVKWYKLKRVLKHGTKNVEAPING